MSVPGWTTHLHILISASVIPRPWFFIKARLLSTWPRKPTNEVTKLNSISFAMIAVSTIAEEGVREPCVVILRPYRGPRNAIPRNMPEKTVEKTERMRMEMASQFPRP
jgi:hypothetical protein